MREPRLIRRQQRWERDFTRIPNSYLRDKELSLKARGLLGWLMSHEAGREITLKQVADDTSTGIAAVRSAVDELQQHGYLVRHPIHKRGQFIGHDWELCDPSEALFTTEQARLSTVPSAEFENRTRDRAEFENRTRTEFENRTAVRRPEEESKTYRGNHRADVAHCPLRGDRGHLVVDDSGVCSACAQRVDLAQVVA